WSDAPFQGVQESAAKFWAGGIFEPEKDNPALGVCCTADNCPHDPVVFGGHQGIVCLARSDHLGQRVHRWGASLIGSLPKPHDGIKIVVVKFSNMSALHERTVAAAPRAV